jgi:hypothetical protein
MKTDLELLDSVEPAETSTEESIARSLWLTPIILATLEAEIRRTAVRSQPGQIVPKTLS